MSNQIHLVWLSFWVKLKHIWFGLIIHIVWFSLAWAKLRIIYFGLMEPKLNEFSLVKFVPWEIVFSTFRVAPNGFILIWSYLHFGDYHVSLVVFWPWPQPNVSSVFITIISTLLKWGCQNPYSSCLLLFSLVHDKSYVWLSLG